MGELLALQKKYNELAKSINKPLIPEYKYGKRDKKVAKEEEEEVGDEEENEGKDDDEDIEEETENDDWNKTTPKKKFKTSSSSSSSMPSSARSSSRRPIATNTDPMVAVVKVLTTISENQSRAQQAGEGRIFNTIVSALTDMAATNKAVLSVIEARGNSSTSNVSSKESTRNNSELCISCNQNNGIKNRHGVSLCDDCRKA